MQRKQREMEEIREAAEAYYKAATNYQQGLAWSFFQSMDTDGDGRVNVGEYIAFLSERGYTPCNNLAFFRQLDRDGDGYLDFGEVITFYYIIKTNRPYCDGCKDFLTGLFFTCVHCHELGAKSFDLCSGCYGGKKCYHEHAVFLDNYALLEHKRLMARGQPNISPISSWSSNNSEVNFRRINSTTSLANPNLERTKSKTEKMIEALLALDAVASIGTALALTANACSIM